MQKVRYKKDREMVQEIRETISKHRNNDVMMERMVGIVEKRYN